jgi:hypothetical protein
MYWSTATRPDPSAQIYRLEVPLLELPDEFK